MSAVEAARQELTHTFDSLSGVREHVFAYAGLQLSKLELQQWIQGAESTSHKSSIQS